MSEKAGVSERKTIADYFRSLRDKPKPEEKKKKKKETEEDTSGNLGKSISRGLLNLRGHRKKTDD